MDLKTYLNQDGSLSADELCQAAGIKNRDMLRQWREGYAGRRPGAAYCVAIEKATGGIVTRAALRPDDYWLIWPDLSAPKPKRSRIKPGDRAREEKAEA